MTPEQLARSGTEHAEQMALFAWSNFAQRFGFEYANRWQTPHELAAVVAEPDLRWLHAIPNAGARGNKIAAAQLKAEGVKAGIADIFLPVALRDLSHFNTIGRPALISCGLYIELKRANGVPSDVSLEQIEFARFVKAEGYEWYVAFGWREAAHIIESYIKCVTPSLTKKQAQALALVQAE